MIIKHRGPGVVPEPYQMKAVDGPPPVGTILCNKHISDDRMEVISVEWVFEYPLFRAPRLEAVVTVNRLPTNQELAEDEHWNHAYGQDKA